jgi:uncharacterized protein YkwD
MENWCVDNLNAHNEIRKQHKLPLFSISKDLETMATEHVLQMINKKQLYHQVPQNCYQNIASGKKNLVNKPELSVQLWMTDNHKLPILNPSIRHIGIAYSIDSQNNVYISCNYK